MPFTTKAELKTALASWMKRSSISTTADDCITLFEARANRLLGEVLTDASLTGTLNSREISVSGNSVAEPIALFLAETGQDEVLLTQRSRADLLFYAVADRPTSWTYLNGAAKLYLDRPCASAYPFRFHFRQRFSLAADGDTNWLLTNHPDVYLSGCIVWGGLFTEDDGKVATHAALLQSAIPEIKAYLSAQRRSVLKVDPGLSAIGMHGSFNYETGQ